jgi:hypothetical protein
LAQTVKDARVLLQLVQSVTGNEIINRLLHLIVAEKTVGQHDFGFDPRLGIQLHRVA